MDVSSLAYGDDGGNGLLHINASHLESDIRSCDNVAPLDEDSCNHFSIRGYVSQYLKNDPKKSSPFHNFRDEEPIDDPDYLPPLSVKKFRRWDCKVCIEKMTSTVGSILRSGPDPLTQRDGNENCCSVMLIRSTPADASDEKLLSSHQVLHQERTDEWERDCGSSPNSTLKGNGCQSVGQFEQDLQDPVMKNSSSLGRVKSPQPENKEKESDNSISSSKAPSDKMGSAKFERALKSPRKKITDIAGKLTTNLGHKLQPHTGKWKLRTRDRNMDAIQEIENLDDNVNVSPRRMPSAYRDGQMVDKKKMIFSEESSPKAKRRKFRRVRLLSDILSSEVPVSAKLTKAPCNEASGSNRKSGVKIDSAAAKIDNNERIGDANLRPIKNKQKYKDLDVVEEGSLNNWLHTVKKKQRSERKEPPRKQALASRNKAIEREIDLNRSQNEVEEDNSAFDRNTSQAVASCSDTREEGVWRDATPRKHQEKGLSTKRNFRHDIGSKDPPEKIASQDAIGTNELHHNDVHTEHEWNEDDTQDGIPMDIVEILAKNRAERVFSGTKDADDPVCTQPSTSLFGKSLLDQNARDSGSCAKDLLQQQQEKPPSTERDRARPEDHAQFVEHSHPETLNKNKEVIVLDDDDDSLARHSAGVPALGFKQMDKRHLQPCSPNSLGLDLFKRCSSSRAPSAVPSNAPFAPVVLHDSIPVLIGRPLANGSSPGPISLSFDFANKKWAGHEHLAGSSMMSSPTEPQLMAPLPSQSDSLHSSRFAQQGLSGSEAMPAMHLLKLLDPSTGLGFRSYQLPASTCCDTSDHDISLDISLKIGGSQATENTANGRGSQRRGKQKQSPYRPLRPWPQFGGYGSFLQREIGCSSQSGSRMAENAPPATQYLWNRQDSFYAGLSNQRHAHHRRNIMHQFSPLSYSSYPYLGVGSRTMFKPMDSRKVARLMAKINALPICAVNQNPADFTIVCDNNKYMTTLGGPPDRNTVSRANVYQTYRKP